MSTPDPIKAAEQAAIPSAIAILQAVQTFVTNLGTDPAQVAAKLPGALQIFIGSVELQGPALATSELSTLQGVVNSTVSGWISKLEAAKA